MSTATIVPTEPFALQVSADDLGPLFIDALQLQPEERSPLKRVLASYRRGKGRASAGLPDLVSHPGVREAGRILASPTFRMENRTGGGALPVSGSVACLNHEVSPEAVVSIEPSVQGSYLLELFRKPWDYLAHWLTVHANHSEGTIANCLPPPLAIEEVAYLLHAVDLFRRKAYESMLAYTPSESVTVTLQEFVGTFKQSLESGDYRWLLPAFTGLTPGLAKAEFDPDPRLLEALVHHDFLLKVEGKDELAYGETAQMMGVEFYHTWMRSAGFAIEVLAGDEWETAASGFLAPTGAANHLFLLETREDGTPEVNHQPYAMEMLETRMARLMADALELEEAEQTPAGSYCTSCGKRLPAAAKFCPYCGAPR